MNLNEIIKKRVSQKKYTDQAVDQELILSLLDEAVYAPNHKMREPWRFMIFDKNAQTALYKRYMQKINEEQQADERPILDKLMESPMWVAVIMPTLKDMRDELEDLQACAAMIQNFLLLATEKGLGTHWKTPKLIESDKFKDALGIELNEIVVAIIMVGYPDIIPPAKPRKKAIKITEFYR